MVFFPLWPWWPDLVQSRVNAAARGTVKILYSFGNTAMDNGRGEGAWRRCPEHACKRKRGCASPRFTCMQLKPKREIAPEHGASAIAML
jgi:hypothetical protein